jgi:hypothetical protein
VAYFIYLFKQAPKNGTKAIYIGLNQQTSKLTCKNIHDLVGGASNQAGLEPTTLRPLKQKNHPLFLCFTDENE